jgi:hypothetical protein
MVAKANFFLETVSHGCQVYFLLGNHQSWLPRLISAWQPSVMVSKAKFFLARLPRLFFAWHLSVMVSKANFCLAGVVQDSGQLPDDRGVGPLGQGE